MTRVVISDVGFTPKVAPKDIQCSGCPNIVSKGRIYVKTSSGRYCNDCADKMGGITVNEEVKQVKRQ